MRIGPELLQDLLDRVEGSLAAAIGTADGLLVEGVRKRPLDLEAAIAEHAALWRQARAAYARSLGAEEVGELLVGGTGVVGYLRSMRTRDPEPLFLLLLLLKRFHEAGSREPLRVNIRALEVEILQNRTHLVTVVSVLHTEGSQTK